MYHISSDGFGGSATLPVPGSGVSGCLSALGQYGHIGRLTLSFDFERLAALVGGVAAVVVAGLQRLVEAVGPAGRRLQAAAPTRRLRTRPPHQVLHPHHHLPGDREDFILNSQKGLFHNQNFIVQRCVRCPFLHI